jgi:CelD/BcsL family acetyltransferase involved in cellulose biosynthesis
MAQGLLQGNTVSAPVPPAAQPQLRVVVVDNETAAAEHVAAWEDLARHSLEPNPFYEPWMLLPAWRIFGRNGKVSLVFIYLDDPKNPAPLLCGFFPLQRRRCKGVPLLALWRHMHCFLGTPLLRKEQAAECLRALLDWARNSRQGASLLELNLVSGEGPFHRLLTDVLHEKGSLTFVEESYTRAFWKPREDAESYLRMALSSGGRQDFRRKRKRLAECGRLESRVLEAEKDLDDWISRFLDLEASGWKGQMSTALAANPTEREYFTEIARSGFRRGQLQMLGLFLDDKPIALKVNFLAGDGAFVFKPAYDESYSRFSPGALVELDNMELCHRQPPVRWMDSCTAADSPMWNRLWMDRRPVRTLLVSTGTFRGDLVVSVRPLLRWLGRLLRRKSANPVRPK